MKNRICFIAACLLAIATAHAQRDSVRRLTPVRPITATKSQTKPTPELKLPDATPANNATTPSLNLNNEQTTTSPMLHVGPEQNSSFGTTLKSNTNSGWQRSSLYKPLKTPSYSSGLKTNSFRTKTSSSDVHEDAPDN
jgi:hypothetical protein